MESSVGYPFTTSYLPEALVLSKFGCEVRFGLIQKRVTLSTKSINATLGREPFSRPRYNLCSISGVRIHQVSLGDY